MMSYKGAFSEEPALCIASVVEVAASRVKAELHNELSELTKTFDGSVYYIGQYGSIIKIHMGRRVIFGFVTLLRMRSEEESSAVADQNPDQRLMEIEMIGEGVWSSNESRLIFDRGVSTYPLPNQGVYLVTNEEATALFEAAESAINESNNALVPFGHYVAANNVSSKVNIDRCFNMHCAVFGSTGSGKSNCCRSPDSWRYGPGFW